jgi:putative ABC transport system permease protein
VAEIDPDHPLSAIVTVDGLIGGRMREQRDYVLVLSVFAFVATLLAAIGIYGVMSYAVSQRTREIGIRMALGARTGQIVSFVGRYALALIAAGLSVGMVGAWAITRLIASQLWGVTPTDQTTFWAAFLMLLLVAFFACSIPARRAMRVDPVEALRTE